VTARGRRDDGQALPLVLVFIVVFGAIVGLLLTGARTNLVMTKVAMTQSRMMYASDGAIESAIATVRSTYNGVCPGDPTKPGQPYDLNTVPGTVATPVVPGVATVNVTCQPIAGPRSNTFGGYSIVTGVTLPNPGGVSQQGNFNCVSMNADGLGSGHATLASGTTCLTYTQPGGSNPAWLQQDAPLKDDGKTPRTPDLFGVYALDAFNIWAVGEDKDGSETIWHSEGDEWEGVDGSTSSITDKNLFGVYAADVDHVWAVGQAGTILACSAGCDEPDTATWADRSFGTVDLNAVSGIDATHVWAVGNKIGGGGGQENILFFDGTNWNQIATPGNTGGVKDKDLLGVYAADANHVWAVGQGGNIFYCSSACTGTTASWANTTFGTVDLTAIDGLDASHVWATGKKTAAHTETVLFFDGASWSSLYAAADDDDLFGVAAADPANAFAVGHAGTAYDSSPSWGALATGSTKDLFAAAAVAANVAKDTPLSAWAVGKDGTILYYTPPVAGSSLATIEGGPVFNAGKAIFTTPTKVANGDFTQFTTGSCPAKPGGLTVSAPYTYSCTSSIPPSIASLPTTYHLPTSTGPFSCVGATVTCTQMNPNGFTSITCAGGTKAAIFAPGYYQTKPNLKQTGFSTYFFESGIYYFKTGSWGGIGSDTNPPWIIGGAPSPNDTPTIAPSSPCWGALSASGYFTNPGGTSPPAGSWQTGGTGVEWILGAGTWLDVHTVHLEIFTREATKAQADIEGAQGISIREVSPGATPAGWVKSAPGGKLQLVQVDANNHNPEFYLHGGIYSPNNNVEFFTNKLQVTTGPILANSLELAFARSSSPPLRINAGGDGIGLYELVATSTSDGSNGVAKASLSVEAVVAFDRKTAGVPVTVNSWRVR
jgi:hypothetical protein